MLTAVQIQTLNKRRVDLPAVLGEYLLNRLQRPEHDPTVGPPSVEQYLTLRQIYGINHSCSWAQRCHDECCRTCAQGPSQGKPESGVGMRVTFASESVTEGYPDKVCDTISDSVLDAALMLDPRARVACEKLVSENLMVITGEASDVLLDKLDIATIARQAIRDIGYTEDEVGFCADTCKV
jgi:hypothetical protein